MTCDSYCSHGGRCTLKSGHTGLHNSGYCTWDDNEALTRQEADEVMAQTQEGRDFLNNEQPLADLLEAFILGEDDDEW
jgi:hypothetical protein